MVIEHGHVSMTVVEKKKKKKKKSRQRREQECGKERHHKSMAG
jgi:hypothetical protein